MNNQEEISFTTKENPESLISFEYDDSCIVIDGVGYPRTPDPDRVRKLIPPNKPIVTYCNTRYYLINSAKVQMVNDLNCIVGIRQALGKELLLQSQTRKEDDHD
jgi:hypothetical protein